MFLPLPDDFHAHLRQGELMPGYVRDLVAQFGRAIIMPNTVPAMTSAKAIAEYKAQIMDAAKGVRPDFVPLMTFKLNPNYTEQDLKDMMAVGVVAGKYYPAGVTTNSADGISDFEGIFPVVAMMEKLGLVLCVHGEEPGEFCLDREPAFIKRVETLASKFPKLKIVFEHLSSAKSVEAVKRLPKFFLGTDSAPHQLGKKECPCGAAGVYSAPVALPLLVQEFERAGHLDKLPDFIAGFGADFYGLPRTTQQIELVKEPWTVPTLVNGVVPLAAGQTLDWKIKQ